MQNGTHALVEYVGGGEIVVVNSYDTPTHTAVNVNGNTLVLAANPNRKYAVLVNDADDATIYISLGVAAAANRGIRLNIGGGNYEMSSAIGNLYTGAIYANHGEGAVNKLLLITEGV
jgi:hypothetical protein